MRYATKNPPNGGSFNSKNIFVVFSGLILQRA